MGLQTTPKWRECLRLQNVRRQGIPYFWCRDTKSTSCTTYHPVLCIQLVSPGSLSGRHLRRSPPERRQRTAGTYADRRPPAQTPSSRRVCEHWRTRTTKTLRWCRLASKLHGSGTRQRFSPTTTSAASKHHKQHLSVSNHLQAKCRKGLLPWVSPAMGHWGMCPLDFQLINYLPTSEPHRTQYTGL